MAAWLLDQPAHRDLLNADPAVISETTRTVLLDEWQRLPQVWDLVRRAVDNGAAPGRFLLTGSATPVAGTDTHSGAGRILSVRMRPMSLSERGVTTPTVSLSALLDGPADVSGSIEFSLAQYAEQIVASGFPGINRLPDRLRRAQLDGYLQRVLDRDLPDQGLPVRRPETLRRWLSAYAAATATTTAYAAILAATTAGDGSQPAKTPPSPTATTSASCGYWIRSPVGARAEIRSPGYNRRPSTSLPTQHWRPDC